MNLKEKNNLNPEKIKETENLPVHIAIITDGNGRWAKERGMSRSSGHKEGINSVRDIVEFCGEIGIKYLTLYIFSTENWKRPKYEVSTLLRLLVHSLRKETEKLYRNNVRLTVIGDVSTFPEVVQRELFESINKLKNNTGLTLNLALNYGGRWDILQAVKKIAEEVQKDKIHLNEINQEIFNTFLATKDIPDPDLLIRTSGEFRISNFLLWQIAYTEIYISKYYWPEFRRKNLLEAIKDYQKRERRFGMVSEQLSKTKK